MRYLATLLAAVLLLAGCSAASLRGVLGPLTKPQAQSRVVTVSAVPRPTATTPRIAAGNFDGMIAHYAAVNGVPASLVHRVIQRESGYNPAARNGPNLGLMQIQHRTAMTMGYRGTASGLLDAETNLKYGVKYLAGAYLVANRNSDQAVRNYSRGYYYQARRAGLLDTTGLR